MKNYEKKLFTILTHIVFVGFGFVLGMTLVIYGFVPNRIEQITTDSRGLSSVKFTQDGKQWGLDYLTHAQLDSLINKLNQ